VTRRRRAALLLGLALVLGGFAAADVSRRERALNQQLGPMTDVVVARRPLAAGHAIALQDLGIRRIPARYAPAGSSALAGSLAGGKLAVPVPAGAAVTPDLVARAPAQPAFRKGQRAIEIVATGSGIAPGERVDVIVTSDRRGNAAGRARLAVEDVEVITARPAPAADGKPPRVTATLRVTPAQAVYLAAAQSFAEDVRLLARAPGDTRDVGPLAVDDGL